MSVHHEQHVLLVVRVVSKVGGRPAKFNPPWSQHYLGIELKIGWVHYLGGLTKRLKSNLQPFWGRLGERQIAAPCVAKKRMPVRGSAFWFSC